MAKYVPVRGPWALRLPYGAPPLSQNRRMHHMKEARERAQIQQDVGWLARHLKIPPLEKLFVTLVWHPKITKTRDSDNPAPTMKACIDGLKKVGVVVDDDHTRVANRVIITARVAGGDWHPGLWLVVHEVLDVDEVPSVPRELLR